MQAKPKTGSTMVSYVWGCYQLGSLIASLFVGPVADNYNHLHEQPVIFYALCVYTHLVGVWDGLNVGLAWAYVAIRIVHSLIQVTTNFVPLRFAVFNLGSLVLAIIALRNVLGLFGI